MKSIQKANLDDAVRGMEEARNSKNQDAFYRYKSILELTLEAIENADPATYAQYEHYKNEEF